MLKNLYVRLLTKLEKIEDNKDKIKQVVEVFWRQNDGASSSDSFAGGV